MSTDNLIYISIKTGTVLAMIISWSQHKSILMALVSWFFWMVICHLLLYREKG